MRVGDSLILRAMAAGLFFLVNLFALYLFWRGHNEPGGGFIGGLASALGFLLLALAFGVEHAQRVLHVEPARLAAVGLAVALASAAAPLAWGAPFLSQYNVKLKDVPLLGDVALGTPLIFDAGVALVVVGVTCKAIFVLARTLAGLPALEAAEVPRYAARIEAPIEPTRPEPPRRP